MAKKPKTKKAKTKLIKMTYFKIKGERVRLKAVEKEVKETKSGIRRYVRAISPVTGNKISKQVTLESFNRVDAPVV